MNSSARVLGRDTVTPSVTTLFENALNIGILKTRRNIRRLADEPKTCSLAVDGNYFTWPEGFFEIGNWTSSFFTGMALIGFELTKDLDLLRPVNRLSGVYRDKLHRHNMDTMHDLGFLYSLYSVALWKITGATEQRELGLKAAEELAKRFVPAGNYIQAWGRMDERGTDYHALAIVDCMMNLPLLFWASAETGNDFFRGIAVRHANTTAQLFVRDDHSVCHAYRFDPTTGQPVGEANYCGSAIGSHWARGTTWAIYGFALAYRYTEDVIYLDTSRRLARKFISLLDDETVPMWDFRAKPEGNLVRDASAASIAAAGFYELAELVSDAEGAEYRALADRLLVKLCHDYLDTNEAVPGLIKRAQVGDGVGRGKNAYTSWGDYYFVEALARRVHQLRTYW